MSTTQGAGGTGAMPVATPAPPARPERVSVPVPPAPRVEIPQKPDVPERSDAQLTYLRQLLRESGRVPELEQAGTFLRIRYDDVVRERVIQVIRERDSTVLRTIPPDGLRELIRPDVLPRGLLLRLVA